MKPRMTAKQRAIKAREAEILARLKAEATAFTDTTPAARDARKAAALADFETFCRTYLPHYFSTGLAPFHRELMGLMDLQGQPVAVAAPRGHGKSTVCTLARPLFELLFSRKRFLVLVASSEQTAQLQSGAIRLELAENERIREDFGDLTDPNGTWARGHFITRNGVLVLARGRGQGVRGVKHGPHRPDMVILDDAETDLQARNPGQVKKFLDYVRRTLMPAMAAGRKWSFFWVDTIKARRSALDTVLQNRNGEYESWTRRLYRALDGEGKALCPELHSAEDLARIKADIGTAAFNQEFLNEPVGDEGLFREGWLREYSPAALETELATGLTVMAIDPSVKDAGKDMKAIVVLTRHPRTRALYVRAAWLRHGTIDEMIGAAYELHKRFGVRMVGLEVVAFSELLLRDFAVAAEKRGYHLPIRTITQHLPKPVRIATLSPLHERGQVFYPEGFSGDLAMLREQLLYFGSNTVNDDGPDALEMCERLLQGLGSAVEFETIPIGRRRQKQDDDGPDEGPRKRERSIW